MRMYLIATCFILGMALGPLDAASKSSKSHSSGGKSHSSGSKGGSSGGKSHSTGGKTTGHIKGTHAHKGTQPSLKALLSSRGL